MVETQQNIQGCNHHRTSFELFYLWFDSLCIVQDDINDWQQEAARMSGSTEFYLEYCRHWCQDGSEGCFFSAGAETWRLPVQLKENGNPKRVMCADFEMYHRLWKRHL
jgi:hypothetical protein